MSETDLEALVEKAKRAQLMYPVGRVSSVQAGLIDVTGLSSKVQHGDQVEIRRSHGVRLRAEILKLSAGEVTVLPESAPEGVALGNKVRILDKLAVAPCEAWIGRIVDAMGEPIDGKPLKTGAIHMPVKASPIPAAQRAPLGGRLETGKAVFNTFLPIVEGQRLGLFAGSGVGKSTLLAHFASAMEADVVVLAMIGERGRELMEFVHETLGSEGLKRTVIVAATSDQSPLMRRRCAWTAMTVAEYFRDQGRHVLFLADSLTRFAEAHREVAVAAGEAASMRGYPPSLSRELMALCERAGPGRLSEGRITAILSVLVAGSDMEEPIADILRGTVDGHVVLSREIAERGRFPAVDLLKSVSRSLPRAASETENNLLIEARALLGAYEKSQIMIDAGLYENGRNMELDKAVAVWSDLDAFIGAAEARHIGSSFDKLRLILRKTRSVSGVVPTRTGEG